VARNLTRPLTFSAGGHWANVLIGNPPWLAFRHMTRGLQKRFRELAKAERIYVGGKMATQNDLCALFTVRAAGLYLRPAGTIAFVLPRAVLRGGQYAPFRAGSYDSVRISWEEAWDLDDVDPLFPVPACVVIGRRRATAKAIPENVTRYAGRLPLRDASEAIADERLIVTEHSAKPENETAVSSYSRMFRNGATLFPRLFVLVERKTSGRLGRSADRPLVSSRRSSQDKQPWKSLANIECAVETEFLRPIYLGESILPFRIWRAFEGLVPVNASGAMISGNGATDLGLSGLAGWMKAAEELWDKHKKKSRLSLSEQLDYYGKLSSQFPLSPLRVVYAKAGTQPAACLLRDGEGVVDHKLYWATPDSKDEGYYLISILNSEEARKRIETLQSRGLFGARDFDKVMFTLPIPRFSGAVALHGDLARTEREAEALAATFAIPEATPFARARRMVRDGLRAAGVSDRIDALVARLLDG